MERLKQLFIKQKGVLPVSIERLPGAGSNRAYYRLTGDDGLTMIGVVGTSQEENHAFLYLDRFFLDNGIPVPEVYAVSDDEMCYLQQDLGNRSLFDAIKTGREAGGRYNADEVALIRKTLKWLPAIQRVGENGMDFSNCYPQPEFDRMNVMFDLNYFKYCYLKAVDVDFNEVKLQKDFERLADDLIGTTSSFFMYRDFQSRNVMLDENDNPYFIDFQGGRRGPGYYDIASFLWQASAQFSPEFRMDMVREVLAETNRLNEVDIPEDKFVARLQIFVLFRTLQVLGAYGYRGYFERKQHFIKSIPGAIANLHGLVEAGAVREYPYLEQVCRDIIAARPKPFKHDNLIVRVYSFSYKKGIPEDISGNGGGYVFDCRSTNNPGRYKEYRNVTGLDKPVIDFLEKDGEILRFLDNIYPLVDFHVQRWLDRGFTDLQISFGCTGGQHRSVYSAQHVAEHIHNKYGVEVHICHRERNIKQCLK